jgi:hypothetical protein
MLKAVEVADPVPLPTEVLVGGVKTSGIRREGGIHSLNFYSEPFNHLHRRESGCAIEAQNMFG